MIAWQNGTQDMTFECFTFTYECQNLYFSRYFSMISKDNRTMYSYKPLEQKLASIGLTKSDLTSRLGISSRTIAKMSKGEPIANYVLDRIASFLACSRSELFTVVYENKILQMLVEEKRAKISGGLYHELQIRMTYNSNHIEGSKLTEDQTRLIFETRTIDAGDGVPVDDIIETTNHFRCVDYAIEHACDPLSEDIIKQFHLLLKQGTADASLEWFNVGDYKKRANVVGDRETCKPSEVPNAMKKLIEDYGAKQSITLDDIIAFHAEFEYIHPFQDGNGRVGRLIAFKECLRWNIIPFIIVDSKKGFYYRGLANWKQERGWLKGTCLDGQDEFRAILKMLDIPED